MASRIAWPDGVEDRHTQASPRTRYAGLPSLALLILVMLLALLGLAGRESTVEADVSGVRLEWHAPTVIRNGEFFEMRIAVESSQPIERLVLGVDASVWEDFTVNTFIPSAEAETSRDDEFRFDFGSLEAGTSLLVKVDAQINPDTLGGNAGTVTVYDGQEALVSLPVHIEVLP